MELSVSLVFLLMLQTATATLVTVGDSLGWTNFDLSTQRVPDYAAWAASQPVHSGDSLVFKFVPGFHDVVSLPTKADFDQCNISKATILDNGSSGNFTWKAPQKAGVYYFACGFSVEGQGTHCDGGQKVSITVIAAETGRPTTLAPIQAPSPARSPAPSSSAPVMSPVVAPPTSAPVSSPSLSQGNVPASQASPGPPGSDSASAQAPAAATGDKSSALRNILNSKPWTLFVVIATAVTTGL